MIDKEMERIIALIIKFENAFKMDRDEVIRYILEKLGYKKYNYIPSVYDNEDLELLKILVYQYSKKYNLTIETMIHRICSYYDFCIQNGFQADLNQTLIIGE